MAKNRINVSYFGAQFTLQAEEDSAYLNRVSEYLRMKIAEVQARMPSAEPLKIAILAALNITDELLKEKERVSNTSISREFDEVAQRLIAKIDETLEDTP